MSESTGSESAFTFQQVSEALVSSQQASRFIVCLDTLVGELFKTDLGWTERLEQQVPPALVSLIEHQQLYNQVGTEDLGKLEALLLALKTYVQSLPVLRLRVAMMLPGSRVQTIWRRCVERVGREVLLEMVVDPGVLGGAVVAHNGVLYDYSVRKQLDEVFSRGSVLRGGGS